MPHLRYFEPHEFECDAHCGACLGLMDETLLAKLDELRHRVKRPLVINSGYRCKARNKAVGGTADSSHMTGMAVDIACPDSGTRMLLVKEALSLGFNRVGLGNGFVHLDIDPDKPQCVLWLY